MKVVKVFFKLKCFFVFLSMSSCLVVASDSSVSDSSVIVASVAQSFGNKISNAPKIFPSPECQAQKESFWCQDLKNAVLCPFKYLGFLMLGICIGHYKLYKDIQQASRRDVSSSVQGWSKILCSMWQRLSGVGGAA